MSNELKPAEFLRRMVEILRGIRLNYRALRGTYRALCDLLLSFGAITTKRVGVRGIVLIGISFSIYSSYLFVMTSVAPDGTQASHDLILKSRWSSPPPSKQVVIVDIDEKSLAVLAPQYGRWPWARQVLAEGIDRIASANSRAILFNVMLSDRDLQNPDSDALMEAISASVSNVAYPLIRLNPENDQESKFKTNELLKRTGDELMVGDPTAAVLLPIFEPMLQRVGVANQRPSADGITRHYPVIWADNHLKVPSIVARTLQVGGHSDVKLPQTINLNWRNKNGRYTRISFSDVLASLPGDEILAQLSGAYVIVGVSAPGVGMTKPTAINPIEDDNEILATALDDLLTNTHLRVIPPWVVLALELLIVWSIVILVIRDGGHKSVNIGFFVLQACAGGITLISASYSNYLIDLTTCMGFGAGMYGVLKVFDSLNDDWTRAKPGIRLLGNSGSVGNVVMFFYRDSELGAIDARKLLIDLELKLGISRVIRIDDLFGGKSFLRAVCEDYSCQLCLIEDGSSYAFLEDMRRLEFFSKLDVVVIDVGVNWNVEDMGFKAQIARIILEHCALLIGRHYSSQPKRI